MSWHIIFVTLFNLEDPMWFEYLLIFRWITQFSGLILHLAHRTLLSLFASIPFYVDYSTLLEQLWVHFALILLTHYMEYSLKIFAVLEYDYYDKPLISLLYMNHPLIQFDMDTSSSIITASSAITSSTALAVEALASLAELHRIRHHDFWTLSYFLCQHSFEHSAAL